MRDARLEGEPVIGRIRDGGVRYKIVRAVKDAAIQAGGEATLFDQFVLFYLNSRPTSGRFPTPRHIIQTMQRLAQIQAHHSLCDLACGSGGCLITREAQEPWPRQIVGVEKSRQWADLARANIMLHNSHLYEEGHVNIYSRDAFDLYGETCSRLEQQFDRMLLAPPFGESVDRAVANQVYQLGFGYEINIALTALTLYMLAEGGCAVILAPQNMLFTDDTNKVHLQTELAERCNLEAVISLPKDALRPFSAHQTYMIVVNKNNAISSKEKSTWFFLTETDGYPLGTRSNTLITRLPDVPNDLTFVEAVMLAGSQNGEADRKLLIERTSFLVVKKVVENGASSGFVISALEGRLLSHMEYFSEENQEAAHFIVEVIDTTATKSHFVSVILGVSIQLETANDRDSLLENRYGAQKEYIPTSTDLLQKGITVQAVAISDKKSILGVSIPHQNIIRRDQSYDLRPVQYVKKLEQDQALQHPAALLGQMWRNQNILSAQIDGLLGQLELQPIVGQELLSPILREITPIKGLSQAQEYVWQCICEISDRHEKTMNGLFTFEDIRVLQEDDDNTRHTLDLFECMGVIVPVTIVDPSDRSPLLTTFYRRITARDLWDSKDSQR
jgi:hypothetical protein